ncbi:MAG: 3-hydroxyacyl-CoA dehydrogenase family protein [Moorellaceae bacterium]
MAGSGMMGSGIAQVFASKGFDVTIVSRDPSQSTALKSIEANFKVLMENGAATKEELDNTLGHITLTADKKAAFRDADIIIENIPENMELKQDFFYEAEQMCREDTILATNTSVMSITEIGAKVRNKSRVIGTHFWNPPFLIPLVEVVRTEYVSDEVVDKTVAILQRAGKHPVVVKKDVPGFVANRLQHALWREAISIVERGIADARTVDECIRYGFGLRLPILGPLENADMVGLDLTLSIHEYILKYLESSPEPSPLLREKVQNGELGFKTGKGFQEWSAEEIQKSRRRLLEYLIKVTKQN